MEKNDILTWAALRTGEDAFFLGYDLREYRKLAELDDDGLAAFLECSPIALTHLALCRRPDPANVSFRSDVEKIASHCKVNAHQLVVLLREVDAIRAMRMAPQLQLPQPTATSPVLMAARDRGQKSPRRKSAKKPKRK